MVSIVNLPWKPYRTIVKELQVTDYALPEDLYMEQWIVPKGTIIKMIVSRNFGTVVLPPKCQDKRGFEIPRRIFQF